MKLTSRAFKDGEHIPVIYTCKGKGISPPLEIGSVPSSAQALVLLVEDPDVPAWVRSDRMWNHWILFNLPPSLQILEEGTSAQGIEGKATGGTIGYEGPCPPDKEHRYFFRLYALDTLLPLAPGASKEAVQKEMEGHILAQATLMGRFAPLNSYQ